MVLFAKNLRHLRRLRGLSQELLAAELDITRARLGAYEETRSEPPLHILIRISEFFKLPVDVLIKNDLTKSGDNGFIEIGRQRVLFPIIVDRRKENLIEIVPVSASAGYLGGYNDPEYIEHLPNFSFPMFSQGKHRAFPIKGDSMLPIKSGSIIIAKFIEELSEIKDGKTYILVSERDGIVYKRVFNKIEENGTLLLVSDNKMYHPYTIPAQEILELWEFAAVINTEETSPNEVTLEQLMTKLQSMEHQLAGIKELQQ
ncbi:MAG: helix-turn-helix domain-containing protein [Chitinophagales bacterium]|nr:helix-turn-helix domain-containing protein [Chitinophagales bacterium]